MVFSPYCNNGICRVIYNDPLSNVYHIHTALHDMFWRFKGCAYDRNETYCILKAKLSFP